jgi:hypothetical protein
VEQGNLNTAIATAAGNPVPTPAANTLPAVAVQDKVAEEPEVQSAGISALFSRLFS